MGSPARVGAGVLGGGALLFSYDAAKRWPLLGNLSHGALMATVASIGRASVAPVDLDIAWSAFVRDALLGGWQMQIAVSSIAAWYLQSNYRRSTRRWRGGGHDPRGRAFGTGGARCCVPGEFWPSCW